ncbi:signal peptide peptidase-like 2A [Xenia sp. Carnegie-2017]|uniref:signal peptide peptidase-like 2A n=1 Tax=Xenia sp. Carnegie-2017 TaxID=2897299 RepID=UPI001F047A4B|nr:signal peptide peptidase-like 2A [Xenia sp. Carnegie-2017]
MEEGQPALVYLVPCTLLTVIVISLIRGEFCDLWHGTYDLNNPSVEPLVQSDDEEDCILTGQRAQKAATSATISTLRRKMK